jgi:hypothetical protein
VYKCWESAFTLDPNEPETRQKQQDLLEETLVGVMQLLFNNVKTRLIKACVQSALTIKLPPLFTLNSSLLVHQVLQAVEIWCGTPEKMKQGYDACIRCFTEREAIPKESFAKVRPSYPRDSES